MNTRELFEEKRYDIFAGPSKETLLDSLECVNSMFTDVLVDFAVALDYTAPKGQPGNVCTPMEIYDIRVLVIEPEDDECFSLKGYCEANLEEDMDGYCRPYEFEALYNAEKREGYIVFFE